MSNISDCKYHISLALPEGVSDEALSTIFDAVEAAIDEAVAQENERCAKIVESFAADILYMEMNDGAKIAAEIRAARKGEKDAG